MAKKIGVSFEDLRKLADPAALLEKIGEDESGVENIVVHFDNPANQQEEFQQKQDLNKMGSKPYGMFYGKERDAKAQVKQWATPSADGLTYTLADV